jgi:hypothetical protein
VEFIGKAAVDERIMLRKSLEKYGMKMQTCKA